jgi:hypothetical protein
MTRRPTLKLAQQSTGPSRDQIKKAVRLFRSEFATRDVRRANARQWLLKMNQLGDKWVYAGRAPVSWGTKATGIKAAS